MDVLTVQPEFVPSPQNTEIGETQFFQPDDLYRLIAARGIHVDLGAAPLTERNRVKLYVNAEAAEACRLISKNVEVGIEPESVSVKIEVGSSVIWGGRTYSILNFNSEIIHLLCDGKDFRLSKSSFENSVKRGEIVGVKCEALPDWPPEVKELLGSASPEDLRIANERHEQITKDGSTPSLGVTNRTINRWKRNYRDAERRWGLGYVGLLPRFSACGNRTPRFPTEIQQIAERIIDEHHLTLKQKNTF